MKKSTRLIPALDVDSAERALALARELEGLADALKVNYPLVLQAGLQIVSKLSDHGDVLCDFKVADIPVIDERIVRLALDAGATGVIVHGFMGRDAVEACVRAAKGDVFVVAELSHPGARQFLTPVAEEITRVAMEAGASGIVAPATRPERISALRALVGGGLILSPGAGAQGGSAAQAIRAGADHVIVGRSIYGAPEPLRAAEGLVREIAEASAPGS